MSDDSREIPPPPPGADHAETSPGTLDRGLALVRFLRAHCPWDAAQTAETLLPHLLEEAHEVAHAIREGDADELQGELGDLLLNLAFQVVVAEEGSRFTADSVVRRLEEKMARRHPHLYGLGPKEDWDVIKAREEARRSRSAPGPRGMAEAADDARASRVLEGVPPTLDPLTRAHRLQSRAAGVGFDWESHHGAWDKVAEELEEVRQELEAAAGGASGSPAGPPDGRDRVEEELGDLLFAVVNLVRLAGAHPATSLDRANRKFLRRFGAVEGLARERGLALEEASLEALDGLWEEVKAAEGRRD